MTAEGVLRTDRAGPALALSARSLPAIALVLGGGLALRLVLVVIVAPGQGFATASTNSRIGPRPC
jgi:hypothetical protein